ncbi:MAG: hypothetical protein AAFO94_17185, partial [Bacteroidota bacterium]
VKLKDGSIITVDSKEDVAALLEECDVPGKRRRCFSLNYPVTVEFAGGSTFEAATGVALKRVIKEWRENNPDAMPEDYPSLVFPYEVTLKNGEVITIESQEDQKELRETCGELWSRWKCFKMVFPIQVAIPNADTDTVTINSPRGLKEAVKRWKQNNPDSDVRPTIVYPIEVELANGEIITINNHQELGQYMEACTDLFGKRRCYKLNYPVTVDFPDGSSAEADGRDSLHDLLKDWKMNNHDVDERPTLAYPFDVTLKDGTIMTIASDEDKDALKAICD